jgi:CRISPR/Cas system-associated endonuclease Cas1
MKVIKNKIINQDELLIKIGFPSYLNKYANDVKHFDITNREGHSAKVYWHILFGNDFIRDQKSFKFPIINSMLNYGYAILRGLFIRSIIKKD